MQSVAAQTAAAAARAAHQTPTTPQLAIGMPALVQLYKKSPAQHPATPVTTYS